MDTTRTGRICYNDGPWLHTWQDVRPPPAPSPQSAGSLYFHQLGKRSSRFCIEDLFCARWGQVGAVEKKMKHLLRKNVVFRVFFLKQTSRLPFFYRKPWTLHFGLLFQVAQMLELYRHISWLSCTLPFVGWVRLGTLSIPFAQSGQQSEIWSKWAPFFDQSASLKCRIRMSFPRTFMVTSPFYEFSAMSASFLSFEDDIFFAVSWHWANHTATWSSNFHWVSSLARDNLYFSCPNGTLCL